MTFSLPPPIRADVAELRRGGPLAVVRSLSMPVLVVLGCVALDLAALYADTEWPLAASAVLALVGGYGVTHGRVADALLRARTGWCAALPIERAKVLKACSVLTGSALLVTIGVGTLLVAIASMGASSKAGLEPALIAMDSGLVLGVAAALLHLTIFRPRGTGIRSEVIREPLFGMAWLDSRQLPHVMDWQRRAALIPWRRSVAAVVVIVPFLRFGPGGASISSVAGPALAFASIVWFALVMRESARVATRASTLLASTPLTARRWRAGAFVTRLLPQALQRCG